jgi:hypothetical protein
MEVIWKSWKSIKSPCTRANVLRPLKLTEGYENIEKRVTMILKRKKKSSRRSPRK